MKLGDVLSAAIWGAASRPVRTASLFLSLGAGVAAAVFVGTVISGFGREIDRLAFGAYARALVVRENILVIDRHRPPNLDDLARLESDLAGLDAVAAWKVGRAQSFIGGQSVAFSVYGAWGRYEEELDSALAEGRMLTSDEIRGYERLCLVGAETAEQLHRPRLVGSRLRIDGVDCEVVGVLGEPRSRPAARFTDAVIAPFHAAERYFIRDTPLGSEEADSLTLFMNAGVDMRDVEMRADLLLRKGRGSPLSQPSPFAFGLASASVKQLEEQRAMMSRLLGGVASLSILTSLIAFGAISAAAISSRRREIALRMALGAGGSDIQGQILIENAMVGLAGGAFGLTSGLALSWTAATLWGWPFAPSLLVSGAALVLGAGTGICVGAGLARQAARLPPSLAARS